MFLRRCEGLGIGCTPPDGLRRGSHAPGDLMAGAVSGTKIVASYPSSRRHRRRRDRRYLPTRRQRLTAPTDRRRLKIPRGLKLPVCCKSSSFKITAAVEGPSAPASMRTTGVTRTRPSIRAAACSTRSRPTGCGVIATFSTPPSPRLAHSRSDARRAKRGAPRRVPAERAGQQRGSGRSEPHTGPYPLQPAHRPALNG